MISHSDLRPEEVQLWRLLHKMDQVEVDAFFAWYNAHLQGATKEEEEAAINAVLVAAGREPVHIPL